MIFQAGTASIYFKPQGALRNKVKLTVNNCTDKNSTFQAVLPCENHTILFPCNFFDNPLCTDHRHCRPKISRKYLLVPQETCFHLHVMNNIYICCQPSLKKFSLYLSIYNRNKLYILNQRSNFVECVCVQTYIHTRNKKESKQEANNSELCHLLKNIRSCLYDFKKVYEKLIIFIDLFIALEYVLIH